MLYRVRGSQVLIECAALAVTLALSGFVASLSAAQAQTQAPSTRDELRLIESTERDLDPLGLDEATGQGLEDAARALQAPKVPAPVARVGEVLSGIEGVFESAHRIRIKLAGGLAFVEETLEISNRSPHQAEVAYRLRVPHDSVPWTFSVCLEGRCREGVRVASTASRDAKTKSAAFSHADSNLPSAEMQLIREGQGRALSIHARPVGPKPITLRVVYLTSAPVVGGAVRLTLPARGFDPRIAPADVSVESRELDDLRPQREFRLDPSLGAEIVGTLKARPALLRVRTHSKCAGAPCSREYLAATSQPIRSRETWLVIDVSPSMEGVARSRVPAVLIALLTQMPDDTTVRAFAFAAHADALGTWPAIEVPLSKLDDALLSERGAGTRVSSVLTRWHEDLARKRPRVVVISDGAFDPDPREQHALDRARRAGAELSLIALADNEPSERSSRRFYESGSVVHITTLADNALSRGEMDPLLERVTAVLSSAVASKLRAGESTVSERRAPAPRGMHDAGDWLPVWLTRNDISRTSQQAAASNVLVVPPVTTAAAKAHASTIPAPAYTDSLPPEPPEATGMPKESVLDLLRTQLSPKARACLRGDRKGRADYAVGFAFRFLIARREVLEASIDGQVPSALRDCLLALLPQLHLPWFTGNLRVRYPVHTEREAEPPVIELEPDLARQVQRVIAEPKLP